MILHSVSALAVLFSLALVLPLLSCAPAASAPGPTPLPTSQTTSFKFESTAMDATVPFLVYLPSGYTPAQKYPVWYAMHGYSSTANWWLDFGRAGERTDALLASGDLEPMIMVFPFTRYDDAKTIEADMADGIRGPSRMERFLCDELIPLIDSNYSTIAAPESRFIGGFSMGGLFALQIGLHRPDLFGKIGAYSPALTYRDFSGDHFERWLSTDPADATTLSGYAKAHGMDKLSIYLDCGGADDPFSAGAASLYDALTVRGISTEFHPHDGGHSLDLSLVDGYLLFYGGD
ncbi:MAG: alpha/beta hydrolase-fold protein [Clostridiaceae bacterium]